MVCVPISIYTSQPDNYDNIFYYTHNGGKSWEATIPIHSKNRIAAQDFDFINLKTGWVMTSEGILYCTRDGGKTWIEVLENTHYKNFSRLDFVMEDRSLWNTRKPHLLEMPVKSKRFFQTQLFHYYKAGAIRK
ncbi:MAG: hypothetical protein HPY74_09770 [Firmicutes bacterium]|nr:hypothetical protein [Bacillota bacterium]